MITDNPNNTCEKAKRYYYDYLGKKTRQSIPDTIINHVSQCKHCQSELERLKDLVEENCANKKLEATDKYVAMQVEVLKSHFYYATVPVNCSAAKPFLPSLADKYLKVNMPTPITAHLDKCSSCSEDLEKIQRLNLSHKQLCRLGQLFADRSQNSHDNFAQFISAVESVISVKEAQKLHKIIYGIYERPDSGVTTCFNIEQQDKDKSISEQDDIYAGFPVSVEVSPHKQSESLSDKQAVHPTRMKLFVKFAAAAAVIIFALIFFSISPTAQAVGLERIYTALEHVKNIYISLSAPHDERPGQKVWISQEQNIKIFKTKSQSVLWDMDKKLRKTKSLYTGSVKTQKLSDDDIAKISANMAAPWGLLPFDDISKVPSKANWQLVSGDNLEFTMAGTEVYDLTWTEQSLSGAAIYEKWRGYIDAETKLPVRIERWKRISLQGQYELESITNVSYPETFSTQTIMEEPDF